MTQKEIAVQLALGSLTHKMKCDVAKKDDTIEQILIILAEDESKFVKWCVAQNPNTPGKVLTKLSTSRFNSIREMVAGNPNTPPKVLRHMVDNARCSSTRHQAYSNLYYSGHHGRKYESKLNDY